MKTSPNQYMQLTGTPYTKELPSNQCGSYQLTRVLVFVPRDGALLGEGLVALVARVDRPRRGRGRPSAPSRQWRVGWRRRQGRLGRANVSVTNQS